MIVIANVSHLFSFVRQLNSKHHATYKKNQIYAPTGYNHQILHRAKLSAAELFSSSCLLHYCIIEIFYRNFNVHLIKRFVLFEILLQNLIVWVYFWHLVGVYVYGKSRAEFNRRIYQILDFEITKVINFFFYFILSWFWSFASFKFILKCGEIARKT